MEKENKNPKENLDHKSDNIETNENENVTQKKNHQGITYNHNPIKREAELMTDEDYINERLIAQRDWYNKRSKQNQHKYKKLKRWEFIIAASIPVLISLNTMSVFESVIIWAEVKTIVQNGVTIQVPDPIFTLSTLLQVIAAIAGIVLVVFNKLLELEAYYKNWKEYRMTNEALEQERVRYLTRSEPYDERDAFPLLVEKIESILNNEKQKWKQVAKYQQSDVSKKAQKSLDELAEEHKEKEV